MTNEQVLDASRKAVQTVIDKFYESNFDPCVNYMRLYEETLKLNLNKLQS